MKFINWYIGKLHMAARHDGLLATAFLEVANLKARPERLLHPAVVARVIWGNLVRRGRSEANAVQAGAGRDSTLSPDYIEHHDRHRCHVVRLALMAALDASKAR